MPIPTLSSNLLPARRRLGRVALLAVLAAATWLIAATAPAANGQATVSTTATIAPAPLIATGGLVLSAQAGAETTHELASFTDANRDDQLGN